ncbi:glycoside hydrolase family 97 protein [Pedobacter sp. ASV12]|uniref:glycoside hydrolase family 97 protein n=1 Tax=Pedobacter sp. ASV12 TaxID=2795120 RepID=UPI0018EC2417|nr:glycoside hydrolase family 97 protein [Pedobacter sp. ASV12]
MKKSILFALMLLLIKPVFAKDYELSSPAGNNQIKISCDKSISFVVLNQGSPILTTQQIALTLKDLGILGQDPKVAKEIRTKASTSIRVDVPVKFKTITDEYNQLELVFKGNYSIIFRAYNNGVAYRFVTSLKNDKVFVNNENFAFQVNDAQNAIWPFEGSKHANLFLSHFEYSFKPQKYTAIDSAQVGLPTYFTAKNGAKIVFTESDLFDYPNLFIKKKDNITGVFPHVILEQQKVGDRSIKILKEADYIAETNGTRNYPWRLWMINDNDAGLLTNTLVYQLATPSKIKDASWIKPGKVAWDWWNDNNIYGVDFKSGINTETYKYYIDFASKYGLEYIMLDEGWTKTTQDILHSNPNIDIPELVAYGKKKNVSVLLWVLWNPLNEKMDEVLDLYKNWGVKGIKVDFMARAEQYMVNFYTRTAEACAKRNLMVDFHGAYKPTGLHRTYPNVISYEGVHGLENNKWEATVTPEHDALLPFTRMMAGPMDYTPGAMRNAIKSNFNAVYSQPMSMGTRAHQTALYVLFESPLQMLADNPSNYQQDEKYTRYLAQFPSIWEDTKVLYADAGKAVVLARKLGNKWYLGGITNWNTFAQDFKLDFLGKGKFNLELLEDGMNANKMAEDYRITQKQVDATSVLPVKMAQGGGFAAVLTPSN